MIFKHVQMCHRDELSTIIMTGKNKQMTVKNFVSQELLSLLKYETQSKVQI